MRVRSPITVRGKRDPDRTTKEGALMRVVVAGSSGMVGRPLVAYLQEKGHQVVRLARDEGDQAERGEGEWKVWRPDQGLLDPSVLEGADAVVNLCGRNIGEARWTAAFKNELRSSRVGPTRLLAATIAEMRSPPAVLVNASATGFYGDRGEETLDESSFPGEGFLAALTREWEAAALPVLERGVRLVLPRLGMVLGPEGALGRMLPIFRLGLGGPLGSGKQWWPWIALDDVVGAIAFALENPSIVGPVNVVSGQPTRCSELVAALGKVLRRPAFLRAHAVALRLVAGEMADDLLLASAKVIPAALREAGFEPWLDDLETALSRAIER
jgi:uncharacterized protein (TIGR01777 family)